MLKLTNWLAQRLDARITLLGVSDNGAAADALKSSLERLREEHGLKGTEIRTRIGSLVEQADVEQHETLYDFIVLAAARGASSEPVPSDGNLPERVQRRVNRLGSDVAALVARATSPIIVLRNAPDRIQRILVCTAVGEPGKHDVHVGGRLARRFEAGVTLLHVTAVESDAPPLVRDHLLRAVATMRALDVPAEARIRPGRSPAHGILDEAREGNHDLIVLGRLAGPARFQEELHDDVVLRILLAADRPVLVVPFESH
jgi:nucleotide-binding universal stress UspA family protein